MAKANVPVSFNPVDTKKVEAALARIQSQAKGVNFGKGAESINKLSRPLGRITGQASEFQKSLEASNARVLAFGASVAVINKLSQAFSALVANTVRVEASFAKINVILGGTQKQIEEFGNGIFKVAQNTATSFDQVAEGALELARQGLGVAESLSRVETALKLVRVAGIDSKEAVAGLTAAIKGFEGAGLTVAAIGDKLAEVDTKFAVSTEDLINGLERASASARVAGVSFDELLGVITTVQERTQRGGAVIGNAFKTIFARLGRTDTLQALQDLGISVLDAQGNVRSAVPLFQELATELDRLGLKSIEAGEIIQKVAGVRQRDILISLVEDLNSGQSQFAKSLEVSAGAAGALDAKNAKLNDTLEALINNLTVGGQKLASVLGEVGFTDTAKDLLKLFGDIVNSITDILQGETIGSKFAKGLVKGIGGTLTPGLALVGAIFIKLFIDLAKFGVTSLKQILGINKAAQQQTALQQSILQTLLQNEAIQREIIALEGNKVAQEQLLLKIYNQQAAALARVQKAAATVTPGLFGAGLRGGPKGVTKRGAGGYVAAEAKDVSRGVGGAPASSKVVSIPNFAFGGGRRGTMVANTSEYFVPNYKGGGDAIFNRDMVKTMGLPSGAKKLNAAGGYIPNFNVYSTLLTKAQNRSRGVDASIGSALRKGQITQDEANRLTATAAGARTGVAPSVAKRKKSHKTYTINLNEVLGAQMPAMFVPTGGGSDKISASKIPGYDNARAAGVFQAYGPNFGSRKKLEADIENKFGKKSIEKFAGKEALGLARNIASAFALKPVEPKQISQVDGVKGFISSAVGAFGGIFDAALTTALRLNSTDEKVGGDFDIDLSKSNLSNIKKVFGDRKYPRFMDNKINAKQAKSMYAKIKKTPSLMGLVTNAAFDKGEKLGMLKGANGYIPNFAGGALEEAVAREKEAGVPISQIRINQSGKLRNAKNPKGLAVTNTRDEPTGKIPNFNKGDGTGTGLGSGGSLGLIFAAQAIAGAASAFVDLESKTGKLIGAFTTVLTSFATFSLVSPSIKDFSTKLTNTSKALKATTLTFDASAKRFRNASGQFASTAAGKSVANRSRGFAAGAAAIGGRALGALGPIAMIASVAIPLVAALKKTETGFSSLSRELDNLDLSKLSGGGSQLMAEFVKTIELNQEKRTQADKIRTDAKKEGINLKGKTVDQILDEQLGQLRVQIDKRRKSDPDRFRKLNDLDKSFISPAMIAAVGFENVQKAINESVESSGTGGNREFTINQDKFLKAILDFAKGTDAFKSAADGVKEANDKLIAESGGSLILGDASKRLKANQRLGQASRIAGLSVGPEGGLFRDLGAMTETSKNIFESQQKALKLAGNLGRLERERLAIQKQMVDFEIKKADESRNLGSQLASQIIKQVEGKVVEEDKLHALEQQLAAGADFNTILEKVNALATDKGVRDSESLKAVQDTVDAYKAQNDQIAISNELQQQFLDKQEKMANMSPLERANEKRRDQLKELSEDVPKRLADNLESSIGNAMDKLASGTYDSIGDVFLNIALDFGKALQKEINAAVAKSLVESFTGEGSSGMGLLKALGRGVQSVFIGGKTENKNSGGLVRGGNGVTDDVPARLTGGEFVIRRSAVQKYGVDFLERLNSQAINTMQSGGYVQGADNVRTERFFSDTAGYQAGGARSRAFLEEAKRRDFFVPGQRGAGTIVGKENLLAFAQQQYTSGRTDVMTFGASGASINLEDQSRRLSAFGRRRDSPARRALREAQSQALDLYNQSAAEEQRVIQENRDAKTARRKAFQQAVIGAVVNATVAGVVAGAQNVAAGGDFFGGPPPNTAGGGAAPVGADGKPTVTPSTSKNSQTMFNALGQIVANTARGTENAGSLSATNEYFVNYAPRTEQGYVVANPLTKMPITFPEFQTLQDNVFVRSSPSFDSISSFADTSNPSYLTSTLTQPQTSIFNQSTTVGVGGVGPLQRSDSYAGFPTPNFSNGGLMGAGSNALLMDGEYVMGAEAASSLGSETLNSMNNLNFANGGAVGGSTMSSGGSADVGAVNIEINIDKDGSATDSATGSGEEDPQKAREFSRKIKDVVLNVINEEKRVSGSLFTRNK